MASVGADYQCSNVEEFRASYARVNFTFAQFYRNTVPPAGQIDQALSNVLFTSTSLLQFGPLTNLPQGRIVTLIKVRTTGAGSSAALAQGRSQFHLPAFTEYFLAQPERSVPILQLEYVRRKHPERIRIASEIRTSTSGEGHLRVFRRRLQGEEHLTLTSESLGPITASPRTCSIQIR